MWELNMTLGCLPDEILPAASGHSRVLVVDDDAQYRDMVSKVLEGCGLLVSQAADGYSALEAYAKEHSQGPGFDLVLLDLNLPKMDGQECLCRLLEIDGAAKVVITSGLDPLDALSSEMQALASGFMQKPFGLKDLLKNVQNLLGREMLAYSR
jgi:DNA-binding NtrC family response regulator